MHTELPAARPAERPDKPILTAWVPGKPQAKGRARHARVGAFVKTYTPEATASYENWIALAVDKAWDRELIDRPVRLEVVVYLARTKGKARYKEWPGTRPDLDNYLKAVMDGISRAGAWRDDSLVVQIVASKTWAEAEQGIQITLLEPRP